MSYLENQRRKWNAANVKAFFKNDPGGIFMGKQRDFVLLDPDFNIYELFRQDVLDYFAMNNIEWWKGSKGKPTGHILSSQIACLNHLFYVRDNKEIATSILRSIDPLVVSAELIDEKEYNSYIEFEFTGGINDRIEPGGKRGANCTSLDAAMVGRRNNGTRILYAIEWKYTESYRKKSLAEGRPGDTRKKNYDSYLNSADSPFTCVNIYDMFYEPYYQLMRQTLLAWRIAKNNSYGINDWLHLHIIPDDNTDLLQRKTSINLTGEHLLEIWRSCLKEKNKYIIVSPEELLKPLTNDSGATELVEYLKKRYWS